MDFDSSVYNIDARTSPNKKSTLDDLPTQLINHAFGKIHRVITDNSIIQYPKDVDYILCLNILNIKIGCSLNIYILFFLFRPVYF